MLQKLVKLMAFGINTHKLAHVHVSGKILCQKLWSVSMYVKEIQELKMLESCSNIILMVLQGSSKSLYSIQKYMKKDTKLSKVQRIFHNFFQSILSANSFAWCSPSCLLFIMRVDVRSEEKCSQSSWNFALHRINFSFLILSNFKSTCSHFIWSQHLSP